MKPERKSYVNAEGDSSQFDAAPGGATASILRTFFSDEPNMDDIHSAYTFIRGELKGAVMHVQRQRAVRATVRLGNALAEINRLRGSVYGVHGLIIESLFVLVSGIEEAGIETPDGRQAMSFALSLTAQAAVLAAR